MSVHLDNIIPWGRSFREYELMFSLAQSDLRRTILGCGDGPASFNAEMSRVGRAVISCDPIYRFSADRIQERFQTSIEPLMSQVQAHRDNYVWRYHRDPDDLLRNRQAALRAFVADFSSEQAASRYVAGALPQLPFTDHAFELAVCSHLLFLYSETLSLDFHRQSLLELCRVAAEVRVFPLTNLKCEISPYVPTLQSQLRELGVRVEVESVAYQFQKNGGQMLRLWK